jgi:hypothetical protein
MKQDIDYLKNMIASKESDNTVSSLKSLQRVINIVDSQEDANIKAFREVFLYLKSIAKHKKKNLFFSLAYEII